MIGNIIKYKFILDEEIDSEELRSDIDKSLKDLLPFSKVDLDSDELDPSTKILVVENLDTESNKLLFNKIYDLIESKLTTKTKIFTKLNYELI
jgi:hypothetical protein